jgi:hypothetical protein
MFDALNFDNFNEADVREEVLAPLIRFLGYKSGTEHNVIREQSLRYPQISMGRKDEKKDPPLRGKADYILTADNKVQWVIEAKSASVPIGIDEIEQAYTYANHPEIRGVFFALCNGHLLKIFQTNLGPTAEPILTITYEEFNTRQHALSNLLSPASIIRDHPEITPDYGVPLGVGLRSLERIGSGLIGYTSNNPMFKAMNEMQVTIIGGAIQRDETGKLVAYVETRAPTRSTQEMIERMGLTRFEAECADSVLSSDALNPSIFSYRGSIVFPKGEVMQDMNTWRTYTLPWDLPVYVEWIASGSLDGRVFSGVVTNTMNFSFPGQRHHFVLPGKFELTLA